MEPISGRIGEKGYIFSIILNKIAIYYDKASSKRITSEIIQAWSPPAEKQIKSLYFQYIAKIKQLYAMTEPIALALKRLAFPKASASGNAENKNGCAIENG